MGNKEKEVKTRKRFGIKKVAFCAGLCLFVIGLIIAIYNISYKDKIFPKTYIGGVNLSGKTKAEAEKILIVKAQETKKNEINLKYLDQKWTINTSDIEVKINPSDSANLAWGVGRSGGLKKIIKEQFRSIFNKNIKLAVFSFNEGKLNEQIINIGNEINIYEKDASGKIDNSSFIVVSEQNGRKMDFEDTKDNVLGLIGSFENLSNLVLKVDEIKPKVKTQDAESAIKKANLLIKNKITLSSAKKNFELNNENIAQLIAFEAIPTGQNANKIDLKKTPNKENNDTNNWSLAVIVDQSRVENFLNTISSEINSEPQDAKFQVQDGKVTTFQTSNTGYKLDSEKARSLIVEAILQSRTGLELPVTVIQPQIASDSATSMGLIELVGEGKSSWRGSPSNRIHNLTLGSQKISGTIVKPGEEFSTIKTIGQIDGSTGFLPELVIKNGTQVVPEYGGGLCQVSTTLFRAVLYSGLKITQREPHSFRVSYYEPPVGMDATIYDPSPDFKFVNTLSKPILIWAIAGNNSLTFQIYGTKDGRNIEVSKPYVGNYVSPPGPVYTLSNSMEPGTVRQVERALSGCTASFHYKVTEKNGNVLEDETFVSKYVALPNSYYYGPGWTPPSE